MGGKDRFVVVTNGTYPWPFVIQIFRSVKQAIPYKIEEGSFCNFQEKITTVELFISYG